MDTSLSRPAQSTIIISTLAVTVKIAAQKQKQEEKTPSLLLDSPSSTSEVLMIKGLLASVAFVLLPLSLNNMRCSQHQWANALARILSILHRLTVTGTLN